MKSLKYRGAIYRLALFGRKKCEAGTHWNDREKRCMKLPPEVLSRRQQAQSASAGLESSRKSGNKVEHLKNLQTASIFHDSAAQEAKEQGFGGIHQEHEAHKKAIVKEVWKLQKQMPKQSQE